MSDPPLRGAFPHQHRDPRGLVERIEVQIRERLEEAIEMASLKLLVDLRARHGRPAPADTSEADRKEFASLTSDVLAHVSAAFQGELNEHRQELERAEPSAHSERESRLAGQVLLARRLPDYWQRLEAHLAAYAKARLESPPARGGWLGRLRGNP